MSQKLILKLGRLPSEEIIKLLAHNGYGELDKEFTEKNVTFDSIRNMTELDVKLWRLPHEKRRLLLKCIEHLKNSVETLKLIDVPSFTLRTTPPKTLHSFSSESNIEMLRTLEGVISSRLIPPETVIRNRQKAIITPAQEVTSDLYDSQGYLKPLSQVVFEPNQEVYELPPNVENNVYEPPPNYNRPPETLPRNPSLSSSASTLPIPVRAKKTSLFAGLRNVPSSLPNFADDFLGKSDANIFHRPPRRALPEIPKKFISTPNLPSQPLTSVPQTNATLNSSNETVDNNNSGETSNDSGNGTLGSCDNISKGWRYTSQHRKLPAPPPNFPQLEEICFPQDDSEIPERVPINYNDFLFFRDVNRKEAQLYLEPFPDGAFLIRPSNHYHLTLTVKCNEKIFNLGIEKTERGTLFISGDDEEQSQEFSSLGQLVQYYENEPLNFQHKNRQLEVFLRRYSPDNMF